MKAAIILHFGSPQNKSEVAPFIKAIFDDKKLSPFQHNPLLNLVKIPIEYLAIKKSYKKYNSIKFNPSYLNGLNQLIDDLNKQLNPDFKTYLAAQYGRPSLEEIFEKMEDDNINHAILIPLYPHASIAMYGSIVSICQSLQKGFFTNIHLNWNPPFYNHPLFIKAWANQIQQIAPSKNTHLLFCAHAHPVSPPSMGGDKGEGGHPHLASPLPPQKHRWASKGEALTDYQAQVETSAKLIWESLGGQNPMSVAYQSAARMGKWTTPSLKDELGKLILAGISNCLIVPVSFIFDNVETLLDIENIAIPRALETGIKDIRMVAPPGNSPNIVQMLIDAIKRTTI